MRKTDVATPEPRPDAVVQVNFRTTHERKKLFYALFEVGTGTATDAFEKFMDAYTAHEGAQSVRHLDGTICPIAGLVDLLAVSAKLELERRHGIHRQAPTNG